MDKRSACIARNFYKLIFGKLTMVIPLNSRSQTLMIKGPCGSLETILDMPSMTSEVRGCVVLAHPHPLHGGNMNNKVVHTLSRAFLQLGYGTARFNFRGVGASAGGWDDGHGEIEDMQSLVNFVCNLPEFTEKPLVLAGFSFGGYIASHVASAMVENAPDLLEGLVLVAPAVETFDVAPVGPDTLLVHGSEDEVVALSSILQWAQPQSLPVTLVPGAGHFFHGCLPVLKEIVLKRWTGVWGLPH